MLASDPSRVLAQRLLSTWLCSLVAIVLAVLGTGCASLTPTVAEPMRIGNTADLSPAELGFRRQQTTFDDARQVLRARGLTGITEDQLVARSPSVAASASPSAAPSASSFASSSASASAAAASPSVLIGVLAADYQRRVHVFRDGRYHESLVLPAGALPYGFAVRLGADETSTMLLVLYRDPLGRSAQPPELLAYRWRSGTTGMPGDDPYADDRAPDRDHFELAHRSSLADLVQRHQGMTNPILVGTTFTEGALLFARDARGRIWDKGYLVRSTPSAVALKAMPWATAMRCSCVQKYSLQ